MATTKKKTSAGKKEFSPKELRIAAIAFKQKLHLGFRGQQEADEEPNFEYTFTINGVEISSLDINGTNVTNIAQSGKIKADTGKPFFIEIRARLNSPVGSGNFQLKFLPVNKNVFETPQQLTFENSGNGGLFLDDVKLPS